MEIWGEGKCGEEDRCIWGVSGLFIYGEEGYSEGVAEGEGVDIEEGEGGFWMGVGIRS